MHPRIHYTGLEALCFRVVRPSVGAYVRPGGDISDWLGVDFSPGPAVSDGRRSRHPLMFSIDATPLATATVVVAGPLKTWNALETRRLRAGLLFDSLRRRVAS